MGCGSSSSNSSGPAATTAAGGQHAAATLRVHAKKAQQHATMDASPAAGTKQSSSPPPPTHASSAAEGRQTYPAQQQEPMTPAFMPDAPSTARQQHNHRDRGSSNASRTQTLNATPRTPAPQHATTMNMTQHLMAAVVPPVTIGQPAAVAAAAATNSNERNGNSYLTGGAGSAVASSSSAASAAAASAASAVAAASPPGAGIDSLPSGARDALPMPSESAPPVSTSTSPRRAARLSVQNNARSQSHSPSRPRGPGGTAARDEDPSPRGSSPATVPHLLHPAASKSPVRSVRSGLVHSMNNVSSGVSPGADGAGVVVTPQASNGVGGGALGLSSGSWGGSIVVFGDERSQVLRAHHEEIIDRRHGMLRGGSNASPSPGDGGVSPLMGPSPRQTIHIMHPRSPPVAFNLPGTSDEKSKSATTSTEASPPVRELRGSGIGGGASSMTGIADADGGGRVSPSISGTGTRTRFAHALRSGIGTGLGGGGGGGGSTLVSALGGPDMSVFSAGLDGPDDGADDVHASGDADADGLLGVGGLGSGYGGLGFSGAGGGGRDPDLSHTYTYHTLISHTRAGVEAEEERLRLEARERAEEARERKLRDMAQQAAADVLAASSVAIGGGGPASSSSVPRFSAHGGSNSGAIGSPATTLGRVLGLPGARDPGDTLYDRSQVKNLSAYGYVSHATRVTHRPYGGQHSVLHSYARSLGGEGLGGDMDGGGRGSPSPDDAEEEEDGLLPGDDDDDDPDADIFSQAHLPDHSHMPMYAAEPSVVRSRIVASPFAHALGGDATVPAGAAAAGPARSSPGKSFRPIAANPSSGAADELVVARSSSPMTTTTTLRGGARFVGGGGGPGGGGGAHRRQASQSRTTSLSHGAAHAPPVSNAGAIVAHTVDRTDGTFSPITSFTGASSTAAASVGARRAGAAGGTGRGTAGGAGGTMSKSGSSASLHVPQ